MQIFVGNVPLEFTDADLKTMFEPYCTVSEARIGRDKKTEASEGYGIVVISSKSEARAAVDALRGKQIQGKPLRVRVLKPGDAFHTSEAGRSGSHNFKSSGGFRGDATIRGTGAIRRGGQRGS